MKNKNKRELEKHWSQQQKKAAKSAKAAPKKKSGDDFSQAAVPTVSEATQDK